MVDRGKKMARRGEKIADKGKLKVLEGVSLRQQPPKPKNHVPMWVWYLAGAVSFIAIIAAALPELGVVS